MKIDKIRRRAFLSGIAGTVALPAMSGTGAAMPGYKPDKVAINTIIDVAESIHDSPDIDTGIVGIARLVAPVYEKEREISEEVYSGRAHVFETEVLNPDYPVQYGHIRPVFKIAFELEDHLGVTVPKNKLLTAYSYGEKLTTIGGILQACRSLGRISMEITSLENPVEDLTQDHRIGMLVAILALMAELAFALVPISFRFAWTTTRIATNRALYRLTNIPKFGETLLPIVMSSVHWLVRDVPAALVEYVLSPGTIQFVYDELVRRSKKIDGFESPSVIKIREGIQRLLQTGFNEEVDMDEIPSI